MKIKVFTFVTLCAYVFAHNYQCNERSTLELARRGSYDFSMRILPRITKNTDAHFIYSPLSTWLELFALADGATGASRKEIRNVTRHHTKKCFRKILGYILKKLRRKLYYESKSQTLFVIDELMKVNRNYIREIERLYGIKVMVLNFDDGRKSAARVNSEISLRTGGVVDDIVYYDDFRSTVLLIASANYFRNRWKMPFNSAYTKLQPFFAPEGHKIGEVSMMNQVGYFHVTDFPFLGAKVLEIPFADTKVYMLVFLPQIKYDLGELFDKLALTSLSAISNMYKRTATVLVNVTMPRFKQHTDIVNLAEIINDLGIKRIFNPATADFNKHMGKGMYASLMTQISDIKIYDGIVNRRESSTNLVDSDTAIEFLVNKPFAYMIVDRETKFILFTGIYSIPSVV